MKRKSPAPTCVRILATIVNLFVGLILTSSLAAQQPSYGHLDQFYAEEIDRFNRAFEKHIKQADKCLNEMDRFEKGEIFLEPVECPKFNQMRPKARELLGEVKIVMKSYGGALEDAIKAGAPTGIFRKTVVPMSRANSLIRIYGVKFQQAQLQSKRVQKLEKELVKELEGLGRVLKELQKEFQSNQETEVQAKPN
ncbi:MAG: hypothetical protein ACE5I9_07730 [Candidatus Methylomirabilales bacterium]